MRWGVAREIVTAWVLTLPCAALVGGLAFELVSLFGGGDTGPIVLSILLVLAFVAMFRSAGRRSGAAQLAAPHPEGMTGMTLLASSTVGSIARVAWSSLLASVLVAVLFAGAVTGLIIGGELRRSNRAAAAAACTAAALVALAICVAAVAYGVILVGQKS